MDSQLYTAASGMVARKRQLDLLAHNLANANTVGFRRDGALFSEYLRPSAGPRADPRVHANIGVLLDASYSVDERGSLRETGGAHDVALRGPGFFAVERDGQVFYTRAGSFSRDGEGRLVTLDGDPVLDAGRREIVLPAGSLTIGGDGSLRVGTATVGRLGVFDLDAEQRRRAGGSLLASAGDDPTTLDEPDVLQGYLESSNVNPVLEMAQLVETQRAFAAYERIIHLSMNVVNRRAIDLGDTR